MSRAVSGHLEDPLGVCPAWDPERRPLARARATSFSQVPAVLGKSLQHPRPFAETFWAPNVPSGRKSASQAETWQTPRAMKICAHLSSAQAHGVCDLSLKDAEPFSTRRETVILTVQKKKKKDPERLDVLRSRRVRKPSAEQSHRFMF